MTALLRLFQPAPHLPQIEDSKQVDSLYHYWRIRIMYSMFAGYAFYYFTRKSFVFAMPGLIEELGMDKAQLGMMGTIFSIVYAFSKFASGVLSDRTNPRYFMAFGLIMTGVVNILFGFSSSILLFAIFWGLNGWFQGFGWPPCARFLTQWYSHSERGSWWSSWNISHNVGSFLIPWIIGFALHFFGWRYAMFIPGMICIAGGFFLINRLRDTPESLGLPSVEKWRNDYTSSSVKKGQEEKRPSTKEILFKYVLNNKFVLLLAVSYLFIYIVRIGVYDWSALFLRETRGYSPIIANGCVSLFDIGGACGALAAGWGSDYLFGAKRGPINALFAVGMLLAVTAFWYLPGGYPWFDSGMMFVLGFTIFGPQMLIGLHAAELSHKEAAATATGFTGWFAYMGAALAGYPLGKIATEWGWYGYFFTLVACCVISILLLTPLWNAVEYTEGKAVEPEAA